MSEQEPKKMASSSVQSAKAATARSSLDLISLSYPFSQVGLLTASDFAKQAERRRSRAAHRLLMDVQVLEELYRHGILVPLFRVDLMPGDPTRQQDIAASLTARHVRATVISELFRGAAEGRAADPATEVFRPWPTDRRRTLWPTYDSGYVYSAISYSVWMWPRPTSRS